MRRLYRLSALIFALGLVCLLPQPAAADATFTVTGIHVDASASSVVEARNAAISGGRQIAWQTLFRRLTRQQDWARQPVLDPAQLQRIMSGYLPSNERRSTTRYVADMTYLFNPQAVAQVLRGAGIPYTAAQSKRVLVIPMAPGYSRGSGWTNALANPRFSYGLVPFAVPIGDAQDQSALNGLPFDTANWNDVAAVAARRNATEAVLALATVNGNKLTVTLRRLGIGELPTKASVDVPLLQGAASTYSAAADAAVHAIEDMWKSHVAMDYSQKGNLVADVRMTSLAQFASVQSALVGVGNVTSVNVVAIDMGEAQLSISYVGTTDQLHDALAGAGIVLVNRGGAWHLSLAGAGLP